MHAAQLEPRSARCLRIELYCAGRAGMAFPTQTWRCRQSVIGECASEPHLFHSSHGNQDPVTCCRGCSRLLVPLMQGSSYYCIGYSKGRSLAATSRPRQECGCKDVSSQACRGVELIVFTRMRLAWAYAQDMTYVQCTVTQSVSLCKCKTIQGIHPRSFIATDLVLGQLLQSPSKAPCCHMFVNRNPSLF